MRGFAVALVALAGCFKPSLTEGLPCAQPDDWCPPPQTCMNGTCGGGGATGDDASTAQDAPLVIPHANFMFPSSTTFNPGINSEQSILDAADAKCNMLGQKLRAGTYMAWLGIDENDAATRIAAHTTGTPGWIRPDGKPFTTSLTALLAGTIYFPPRIDDNRADVVAVNLQTAVMTELDPTGCGVAKPVRIGLASGDEPTWRSFDARGCNSDYWLYCFEVDLDTPVDPPVFDSSLAIGFATRGLYPISDGFSELDDFCQAEANGAGYSARRFRALAATSTANARSRFLPATRPWTRFDGVVFASSSLGTFDAPLSIAPPPTPSGSPTHVVSKAAVGAANLISTASINCTDWSSTSLSAAAGDTTLSDGLGFDSTSVDCSSANTLYCLEAP